MKATLIASLLACAGLSQACVANAANSAKPVEEDHVVVTSAASSKDSTTTKTSSKVSVTTKDGNIVAVCEADSPSVFTINKDGNVTVTGAASDSKDHKVYVVSPKGKHELKTSGKSFKVILEKDGEPRIVELKPGEGVGQTLSSKGSGGATWTVKGDDGKVFELKGLSKGGGTGVWTSKGDDVEILDLKSLPKGTFELKGMPKGEFVVKGFPEGKAKFFSSDDDHLVFVAPDGDFDWKQYVPEDARKWIDKDMNIEFKKSPDGNVFFFEGEGESPKVRGFAFKNDDRDAPHARAFTFRGDSDAPKARAFAFRGDSGEAKGHSFVWKSDDDQEHDLAFAPSDDRPRLGVMLEEGENTLRVSGVMDGLPAKGAGVKEGDTIFAINGAKPATMDRLRKALGASEITLSVDRDGDTKKITVKLGGGDDGDARKWVARTAPRGDVQKRESVILRERAPRPDGPNWTARVAPKAKASGNCECCACCKDGNVEERVIIRGGPIGADGPAALHEKLGKMRTELHLKREHLDKMHNELRGKLHELPNKEKIVIELKKNLDDAREAMDELDFDIDFDFEFDAESMQDMKKALHEALSNVEIDIDREEIQRGIEQAMKEMKEAGRQGNVLIRRMPEAVQRRQLVEKEMRQVERDRAEAHRFEMEAQRRNVDRQRAEFEVRREREQQRARENASQGRNQASEARLKELEARLERIEALLKKLPKNG